MKILLGMILALLSMGASAQSLPIASPTTGRFSSWRETHRIAAVLAFSRLVLRSAASFWSLERRAQRRRMVASGAVSPTCMGGQRRQSSIDGHADPVERPERGRFRILWRSAGEDCRRRI